MDLPSRLNYTHQIPSRFPTTTPINTPSIAQQAASNLLERALTSRPATFRFKSLPKMAFVKLLFQPLSTFVETAHDRFIPVQELAVTFTNPNLRLTVSCHN